MEPSLAASVVSLLAPRDLEALAARLGVRAGEVLHLCVHDAAARAMLHDFLRRTTRYSTPERQRVRSPPSSPPPLKRPPTLARPDAKCRRAIFA